jgi:hypothetical protein
MLTLTSARAGSENPIAMAIAATASRQRKTFPEFIMCHLPFCRRR